MPALLPVALSPTVLSATVLSATSLRVATLRVATLKLLASMAAGLCATALLAISATAADINTGGASGAYHTTFCPNLVKQLELLGTPSECLTSQGTGENLKRVARNAEELGYGQLDVYALEADRYGGTATFQIIRSDDVRECVFAVTRNRDYTNFGELAVNADRLNFVLPPKSSGSAKTFQFMQKIDPNGLGRARNVSYEETTDAAIERALEDENSVTFFVQFPDPANPRFRRVNQLNGHIVPVVDSVLLSQKIDDQTIYYAQETSISQLKWLNLGRRVVTVCTPLVLFTGASRRIDGRSQRANHRQLVLNIRSMLTKELVPAESPIARILATTRSLSERATLHFQELSLNARERARPFFERMYRGAGNFVRLMVLKARPPEHLEDDPFAR